GDDLYTDLWRGLARCEVITFGLSEACDVRASHTGTGFGSQLHITTSFPRRRGPKPDAPSAAQDLGPRLRGDDGGADGFSVTLAAAGEHNVRNALAAVACALGAGIDQAAIVRGLESFAPAAGRLQRKQASNGATVIDDTYNA